MSGVTASEDMRVLSVKDEPYLADAIRNGLRLEPIAVHIADDGDTPAEGRERG